MTKNTPESMDIASMVEALGLENRNRTANASSEEQFRYENEMLAEAVRLEKVKTDGHEQYYFLQRKWSYTLMGVLIGIVVCQVLLCGFLGMGKLHYKECPNFLYLQTVEFFGQILVMCYVVVQFLFGGLQGVHGQTKSTATRRVKANEEITGNGPKQN